MSGYRHFDRKRGDDTWLRRCDACGADEQKVGVDTVEVEHPDECSRHAVDACRDCEADYDLLQALVADRHPVAPPDPVARPFEPDEAERRVEADLARWEQYGEMSA